jgi:hypothetical protein
LFLGRSTPDKRAIINSNQVFKKLNLASVYACYSHIEPGQRPCAE